MVLLIVEDNAQMRRMIRSLVEDLAERCYECGDGEGALAAYTEHRPDWVLMDIRMEGVDGLEATRRIRAEWPEARIMIVTDYNEPELREEARRAGACEYVVKEDLLDVRRRILAAGVA